MKKGPTELFKYPGGKTALLPQLTELVGEVKGCYIEPFVGGGRLLTHLLKQDVVTGGAIWDAQPLVRLAWEAIRDEPDELSDHLEELRGQYAAAVEAGQGLDMFESLREQLGTLLVEDAWDGFTPATGAYLFIAYTRLTHSGLWRVNQKSGTPNVPWNGRPDLPIPTREFVKEVSARLESVKIPEANDWKDLVARANPGDLVYLDPPYVDLPDAPRERGRPRGFVAYTAKPWSPADHAELIEIAARVVDDVGATVLVSSSGSAHTRAAYQEAGFEVFNVGERRSINRKATARGPVPCIIARRRVA